MSENLPTTTAQFEGYEVISYRSETTGKPIKYQAVTDGGNETPIVKKSSEVHELAQKLVASENAEAEPTEIVIPEEAEEQELRQLSLSEVAEELTADTEQQIEDGNLQRLGQEPEAEVVAEDSPEADFAEAPAYELEQVVSYSGAPKDFWRSLGRFAAQRVAGRLGILAQPSNADMTVKLAGDKAPVEQAAEMLQDIWPGAIKEARSYFRNNEDAYQGNTLATSQERKARFALKQQFLSDWAEGYIDAAFKSGQGDRTEPGYLLGRNAWAEGQTGEEQATSEEA